jgi:penicillin amidase/acyl-homoserine-lactone acylase
VFRRVLAFLALFAVVGFIAANALGRPGWSPAFDPRPFLGLAQKYDVRILRDTWGIPHIYGKRDADAAFGVAYAHAEDDFETLQQTAMTAQGRLSSEQSQLPRIANSLARSIGLGKVFDSKGLDPLAADYLVQLLQIREKLDLRYESGIPADVRAAIEAYADGLNFYAAKHPAEVSAGFRPVTGKDVAAGFMFFSPLFFGLERHLSELFEPNRAHPVSLEEQGGSNAYAVAPKRSSDGHTRLLINSHQPYEGALAWYELRVHSQEGWDMAGGTFPGSPFVLHGFGPKLGWANTVNTPDLTDIYALTINPNNPDQYRLDGQWRDFSRSNGYIEIRIAGPLTYTVTRPVLQSVYGPVIRRPHGAYAIRYAGHDTVNQAEQYFRLNKAQSHAEFEAAMRLQALPNQNYTYADATGRIAYYYNAQFPKRDPAFDWAQYLPGDRSKTLWTEYLGFDSTPHIVDPPAGYLFNANNTPFFATAAADNLKSSAFDKAMGIETRMTNRALRAFEQLDRNPAISAEAFRAYKFDKTFSAQSQMASVVDLLLAQDFKSDVLMTRAQEVLRHYDMTTKADSRGAALAIMTGLPTIAPTFLGKPANGAVAEFRKAASTLMKHFGRLDPTWAEVNRFRRGKFDIGTGGGPDVLRAVETALYPGADGRFTAVKGDTLLYFVDWDPSGKVSAQGIHQFGSATKNAASPHYADQVEMFLREETRPVYFDEEDLRKNLEREYRPGD